MTKIGILLQKNCHKCYNGKKYGGELCYIWGGELLSCRVADIVFNDTDVTDATDSSITCN